MFTSTVMTDEEKHGLEAALKAIDQNPQLRWKVEAWLKAKERKAFREKVSQLFEHYWRHIREKRINENLIEALSAIEEIKSKKDERETRETPIQHTAPQPTASPGTIEAQVVTRSGEFDRRNEQTRLPRQIPVSLIMPVKRGAPVREETFTENISVHGASIYSNLPVEVGRSLQLIRKRKNRSLLVVVRGVSKLPSDKTCLHLQVINEEWFAEDLQPSSL